MGREKWTKRLPKSDPRRPRLVNTATKKKGEEESHTKPTRAICDFASKQNWVEALRRCRSHPQDMDYAEVRGTMLHFALWSHRRVNQTPEEEAVYCQLLDTFMAHNPDMIFAVGSLGMNPLHIASSKDSTRTGKVIATLLERSVPPGAEQIQDIMMNNANGKNGYDDVGGNRGFQLPCLPLELYRRIVGYIPNTALMKDSQGKTPLFLACQVSKNIPRRDKIVTDALMEIVDMLVKAAPKAKEIADKTGRTPLMVVRKQKKFQKLEDLFLA